MKLSTVCLSLLFVYGTVAYTDDQLANELAFAKHAVNVQLKQDRAPESVLKEEAALFSQAETAIKGTGARKQNHGTSFLAHRASAAGQSTQALATKVTREVQFASKAMEVQLGQDHAPSALVQEEKGLLAKAAAAAQRAERMVSKQFELKGREHSLEQILHLAGKQTQHTETKAQAGQELVAAEQAEVKEVSNRLKQTQFVENQASKALQGMHVNVAKQRQVADLLAKAERAERAELTASQQSAISTQRLESELAATNRVARHSATGSVSEKMKSRTETGMLESVASQEAGLLKSELGELHEVRTISSEAKKAFQKVNASSEMQQKVNKLLTSLENDNMDLIRAEKKALRSTKGLENVARKKQRVHEQQSIGQSLAKLERKNSVLHADNVQLKAEHAVLVHEENLVEENTALAKENVQLQEQNTELKHKLTGIL